MGLLALKRWLTVPLLGILATATFASTPPPDRRYSRLALYDGPGRLCLADFSIELLEGEFAIRRMPRSFISIFQIELANTRLLVHQSFSSVLPAGTPVRAVGQGQLLIRSSDEGVVYDYSGRALGGLAISGPDLTGDSSDRAILDRITFEAPISGTTACIDARLEEPEQ